MGRPRKATSLLLVEGGFRPDRHADRVPEPAEPVGQPPAYLSAPERRAWREVADGAATWLRKSDRHVLELYSRLLAQSRTDFATFSAGRLRALVALATLLGLGPVARARVSAKPRRPTDDADGFFDD